MSGQAYTVVIVDTVLRSTHICAVEAESCDGAIRNAMEYVIERALLNERRKKKLKLKHFCIVGCRQGNHVKQIENLLGLDDKETA